MRNAEVNRETKETKIQLWLELDGTGKSDIDTGIGFMDHMLTLLAKHSGFDLVVHCDGDTYVDDHHSVEDIGISFGRAFSDAIWEKRGICRYGDTTLPMDEALILTAVDISGRACLCYDMDIPTEKVGTFDTELVEEFLTGFVRNAGITLHVRQLAGRNSHHIIEGMFKSLGHTLRKAVAIDERFRNEIPSTKGTLSEPDDEIQLDYGQNSEEPTERYTAPSGETVKTAADRTDDTLVNQKSGGKGLDDSYARDVAHGYTETLDPSGFGEPKPLSSTAELEKELLEKGLL